jgi:hypothetical protein
MPDVAELNAAVFVLLLRARNAWEKGERAWARGDTKEVTRLTSRAVNMRRDADTLDPRHECAAWSDHLNGTHSH